MSLKLFHLVFIVAAFVLALWTGFWALGAYRVDGGGWVWMALGAFAVAAGLVVYGSWFLRKMRGVSYL